MTSLADRLRGVVIPGVRGADLPDVRGANLYGLPGGPEGAAPEERVPLEAAAEALGGEWRESGGQRYLVVDRRYAPSHRHGHVAVGDAASDAVGPGSGCWPRLHLLGAAASPATKFLFLDLETTGLAGGAGTYAFLVGCAWFQSPSPGASAGQGGSFHTRQFFLSSFAAERVLLDAVAELAHEATVVITYNGKTFDLPLIETRFLLHRRQTPFASLPHVDMLHPARRLWRSESAESPSGQEASVSGCRLTELEHTLLGHERLGDVPGFEIPSRYFHFVRTGDARPLEAVLEHNRLDLLSLALVTARAAQMLDDGAAAARTAREAFGMGRLFERGGMATDASACYQRAAELPGEVSTHAEALRGDAVLARRQRRYTDAAVTWRRLLDLRGCPPEIVREASEALAVHHEHRLRDLELARRFALQSLHLPASIARQQAVQHRLARLDRKLGAGAPAALF